MLTGDKTETAVREPRRSRQRRRRRRMRMRRRNEETEEEAEEEKPLKATTSGKGNEVPQLQHVVYPSFLQQLMCTSHWILERVRQRE